MHSTVAIIGYGSVGHALEELFPGAVIYDEPLGIGSRDAVNACDFACVAVPTPEGEGGRCNTSIVEHVVNWVSGPKIIVFSTIEVGTTERLVGETGKAIVHQPTFGPGDTPAHPFGDLRNQPWIILGGERQHTTPVADLYKRVYNAEVEIWQTDGRTAELTKYMENAFLALKVSFCNEMYDIAEAVGVDYNELRELWLRDPRIGRSHTLVYPDARGYGGKCLPKDVKALVLASELEGFSPPLMKAMISANARFSVEVESPTSDPEKRLPA